MMKTLPELARPQFGRRLWFASRAIALRMLVVMGMLGVLLPAPALMAQEVLTAIDAPLGSGFTYQGRLDIAGAPVNATCAMQ